MADVGDVDGGVATHQLQLLGELFRLRFPIREYPRSYKEKRRTPIKKPVPMSETTVPRA